MEHVNAAEEYLSGWCNRIIDSNHLTVETGDPGDGRWFRIRVPHRDRFINSPNLWSTQEVVLWLDGFDAAQEQRRRDQE